MGSLDYLNTYKSLNTIRSYKYTIKRFLEFVYATNIDYRTIEWYSDKYLSEKRANNEDVENFFIHIKDRPPLTIIFMLAGIKSFFFENDKALPNIFWKRLTHRVQGSRAVTIDKVPSNIELKQILSHMPIHGKALYLVLSSSGMRIGECLRLKLNDIELDTDPVRVNLQADYTKSGNNRLTFVSTEAKEAILEWMKVREEYIKSAVGKSWMYGKQKKDDRLFPFTGSVSHIIWKIATEKVGLLKRDPRTKKYLLHPHSLRKFFRTRMGAMVPVDIVEAIMGHEGYLTEVYRKYTPEDLANFYKKGEPSLTIFSNGEQIVKLRDEVAEKEKQLQTLVNGLTSENFELKERMAKMEATLNSLQKTLPVTY